MVDDGKVRAILADLSQVMQQVQDRKSAEIESARGTLCPVCGTAATVASYSGFIEPGLGLTERLIAACPNGHEWAVHDPLFQWDRPTVGAVVTDRTRSHG